METKKVFKKMKSEVGAVLSTVAIKTEFVAKLSKLKIEIVQKKAKVNSYLRDIGEYIYNKRKDYRNDPNIADMIKEIDELKQSIEDIKSRIDDIRQIQKEKQVSHEEINKDIVEEE